MKGRNREEEGNGKEEGEKGKRKEGGGERRAGIYYKIIRLHLFHL